MIGEVSARYPPHQRRLLVDTNLLVLLAVGSVNPKRIEVFKRTRQYTRADFALLQEVLERFESLYTVAHVMAEVSNLTDLGGYEQVEVRRVLRRAISVLKEVEMPSAHAADDALYEALGLVDAAIASVATAHHCTVLTDDFSLYDRLIRRRVQAINFTHLRAQELGL